MDGLIPHTYKLASDDIGFWEADRCNRQAVTAAFAYEHLCDQPVYLFNAEAAKMGLDPWTLLSGMDCLTDGTKYIAEFGSTGERLLDPKDRVYAQRNTLRKLGLPEGEPGGWKVS